MSKLTYRQLKEKLDSLTDAQLDWPVVIFEGDHEQGNYLEAIEESGDDIYWLDGECYGMKKDAEDAVKDDEDISIEHFTVVPKGTITLHYSLSELVD